MTTAIVHGYSINSPCGKFFLENKPFLTSAYYLQLCVPNREFRHQKHGHKRDSLAPIDTSKQANTNQYHQTLATVYSTREAQASARGRSGGRCECDGLCARQHTGRCLNVEGRCAAGSRYPVRLRLVAGRELCPGFRQP